MNKDMMRFEAMEAAAVYYGNGWRPTDEEQLKEEMRAGDNGEMTDEEAEEWRSMVLEELRKIYEEKHEENRREAYWWVIEDRNGDSFAERLGACESADEELESRLAEAVDSFRRLAKGDRKRTEAALLMAAPKAWPEGEEDPSEWPDYDEEIASADILKAYEAGEAARWNERYGEDEE